MTGLILCGGQSRRMGTDKGLLKNKDNVAWASLAFDKLRPFCESVYVSVNPVQRDYTKIFPKALLIEDDVSVHVKGPLLGLLSAFMRLPQEDIFVLACDLVDMDRVTLLNLYSCYEPDVADVFLYRNRNFPEPLCGIYTKRGLARIHQIVQKSGDTSYGIRYFLTGLNVLYLDLPELQQRCFRNYNYPL